MLRKLLLTSLSLALLQACAGAPQNGEAAPRASYRAASAKCLDQAERKEKLKVPCGGKYLPCVTTVETRSYYDATLYNECMSYAGHAPAKPQADEYLQVARICLNESRAATNPDATYAECVKRNGLSVDVELIGR